MLELEHKEKQGIIPVSRSLPSNLIKKAIIGKAACVSSPVPNFKLFLL